MLRFASKSTGSQVPGWASSVITYMTPSLAASGVALLPGYLVAKLQLDPEQGCHLQVELAPFSVLYR